MILLNSLELLTNSTDESGSQKAKLEGGLAYCLAEVSLSTKPGIKFPLHVGRGSICCITEGLYYLWSTYSCKEQHNS